MKKRELKAIVDYAASASGFPDVRTADRLLYFDPVDSVLTGIAFTPYLRHPDLFNLSSFARPLYVPWAAPIYRSHRITQGILGDQAWNIKELESSDARTRLAGRVKRHLRRILYRSSPRTFAEQSTLPLERALEPLIKLRHRDHLNDFSCGLSYARAGDVRRAIKMLRRVNTAPPPTSGMTVILPKALQVYELLQSGAIAEVNGMLDRWEAETIQQFQGIRSPA